MNQQTRISARALALGFNDPPMDAQRIFRQILQAMARPGQIVPLDRLPDAPAPMSGGTAAVALSLFDLDTPLWLSDELRKNAGAYLAFHTGAPLTENIADASFLLLADGHALPDLSEVAIGDAEYPERAATIIIQVDRLQIAPGRRLRGPGILGHVDIRVDGLAEEFWAAFEASHRLFPLGFDVILVAGESILALPRTVSIGRTEE
jgi:alpha-D-ribose 1-methylphosphonate 5-triphosphate synthase subunit PhnH